MKVTPPEDDEADEEGEAIELWQGRGAVRLLRRDSIRRVLLVERARPGTDISDVDEDEATSIAVAVGLGLGTPFQWIGDHVPRWLAAAKHRSAGALLSAARALAAFAAVGLDEGRTRAWAVIRGAYLGADEGQAAVLRALV